MNGRTLLVLASTACAACSLFLDTSDFTQDGAGSDAGSDTSDASSVSDSGGNDGGGPSGDAAVDADASRTPCPDGAFCDSFERTGVVGAWGGLVDNGGGCSLAIDDGVASDGKSSLKLSLVEKFEDNCQVTLTRDYAGPTPKKLRLSFDFRVAEVIDREVQIASVGLADPDRVLMVALIAGGVRLAEQQFGPSSSYKPYAIGGVEPGEWHHIEVVHDTASRSTQVTYDGSLRMDGTTNISFVGTGFDVALGTNFTRGGGAGTLWFDDYRFLPEP